MKSDDILTVYVCQHGLITLEEVLVDGRRYVVVEVVDSCCVRIRPPRLIDRLRFATIAAHRAIRNGWLRFLDRLAT